MGPNERHFEELMVEYMDSRVPQVAPRTTAEWRVFNTSAQGKIHNAARAAAREIFFQTMVTLWEAP